GSDAAAIRYLQYDGYGNLLHPDLPYTEAEVIFAVSHEMAQTLEDVLLRRTRALILDAKAAISCAPKVAELMRKELNKDDRWKQDQLISFNQLAEGYLVERGL
ncbi:MAG: glycerol-3-phosphate dehydrogenase C-terminal domain-containing protein, partial [Bacteroidota bacterium]